MTVFDKNMVATAALLAAITIAMGALGAHGLKNLVDEKAIQIYETGIRYQMYHVLAILVLGIATLIPEKIKKRVFWFFICGIILFSGSIYLLALNAILPFDAKIIGIVTPIGGLLFIIGWILLGYGMVKLKKL